MKKSILLIMVLFLAVTFVSADYVGKSHFKNMKGKKVKEFRFETDAQAVEFMNLESSKGNLKRMSGMMDKEAGMSHVKLGQYHNGIKVFGGEVIQHMKNKKVTGMSGHYFRVKDVTTTPALSYDEAVLFLKENLGEGGLKAGNVSKKDRLLIYPVSNEAFRLVYRVVLDKGLTYSMTGLVDAVTGDVLFKYSNVHRDTAYWAYGTGYHNDNLTMVSTKSSSDNYYRMFFELKGSGWYNQYIYDCNHSLNVGDYPKTTNNSNWPKDSNNNVNAYLFNTYNYFKDEHNRSGANNANMDVKAYVHVFDANQQGSYTDNAMWNGSMQAFIFCDPYNEYSGFTTGAALDVVAHEFSHAVTSYTSNLVYQNQSGALNESFSDIMGAAVEWHVQSAGYGFNKADWVMGEDCYYSFGDYLRSLENPNARSQTNGQLGPDPSHLNQYIETTVDYGGVHLNATIYPHAYYLLTNGGTHTISNVTVTGIGVEKATKIFYRAWTHYLTSNSQFVDAANAVLNAAYDLYGSGTEYTQAVNCMEAIGWQIN